MTAESRRIRFRGLGMKETTVWEARHVGGVETPNRVPVRVDLFRSEVDTSYGISSVESAVVHREELEAIEGLLEVADGPSEQLYALFSLAYRMGDPMNDELIGELDATLRIGLGVDHGRSVDILDEVDRACYMLSSS
jgi:hypothetical protein